MKDHLRVVAILMCCCVFTLKLSAQNPIVKLTWKLAPQAEVTADAGQISAAGFKTDNWVKAVVPGTAFYSYVKAGKEADPDYADNIYKVDKAKYNRPFWYRTEFTVQPLAGKRTWLNFNGINKRAEVFVNGHHIGTIKGLMARGRYDVTDILNKSGANAVAVLVVPPRDDPEHNHPLANWESPTYICAGSWDWMPAVPGLDSGITDSVTVTTTRSVSVQDPWVRTNLVSKQLANLTINTHLVNPTSKTVSGHLNITIMPGNLHITGPQISLAPGATVVNYDQKDFAQLSIKNPKLWWPNGYGGKADGTQYLYTCAVSFAEDGKGLSDQVIKSFGIRKVTSDTTALKGPMRVYINDVPVLLKGGNWGMSDYMLKVRGKDYEPRIRFHKEMNYNAIRNWTGEVTDEAFYDYCDKYGIMVWDDFWLNNMGGIDSVGMFKANAIEKVKKFRDHPSIVIWCGANEGAPGGNPHGDLSKAIMDAIAENDGTDKLYLPRSNAGVNNPNFSIHGTSRILSGSGNWANTDPKTYFTDPHNGYLFSKDSYGMRSELGSATFVNVESFKKFMPPDYWKAPTEKDMDSKTNMWARHYFCNDGALGGGSAPAHYIHTINTSYGEATSLEDFCKKAQMLNVETLKAMYEAWNDHMWNDASGMLIWMSQSAYPTMIWQTYDYYYDLTGAYFGSKMACEPVHIQWNPATNSVKVINNRPYDIQGLKAEAQVFNSDGSLVSTYTKTAKVDIKPTSAKEAFLVFDSKNSPALSDVHFLKLKLTDAKGKLVSENFYWIGNTYLDYTALNKLPHAGASLTASAAKLQTAANGVNKVLSYTVSNKAKKTVAFGIRAQLLNNKGQQILPAIFDDGYFTLMPGETKKLTVEVTPGQLASGYKLDLKAYNN